MSQSRPAASARGAGPSALVPIVALLGLGLAAVLGPGGPARAAQPPAPPAKDSTSIPAEGPIVADVTTRYRFIERYATAFDRTKPEIISQYRVAIRETVKTSIDQSRGAPVRGQFSTQTVFSERPAQVSHSGMVTDSVRRYEAFRVTEEPPARAPGPGPPPKWLEGLTLWYHPQLGREPQILVLTPDRGLRDYEYDVASRQAFLPDLAAVLPALPSRIGDRWALPRAAVQAILGERPARGGNLFGSFLELRKGQGNALSAIIGIAGRASLPAGEVVVNAQVSFAFLPPSRAQPAGASGRGGPEQDIVDARGAINELRLSMAVTVGLPGSNDRLRRTVTRELVLGRQLTSNLTPLPVPDPPPQPTEANSWLTYDDPQGRFHLRHPQEFRPDPSVADGVVFKRLSPEGLDSVDVRLQAKGDDPQADRQLRDPEYHRKRLIEEWRRLKLEVFPGPAGWLPESDWAPSKMKVYLIVAALKVGGQSALKKAQRVQADFYLVLFTRNESLIIVAMSSQDSPTAFRRQVEAMLKTFQLGRSQPGEAPGPVGGGKG